MTGECLASGENLNIITLILLCNVTAYNRVIVQWTMSLSIYSNQRSFFLILFFCRMVNFCPHCGKKAEKEFKFCPYCGSKLPIEEIVESETSSQNEHNQQPAGGEKCNKRRSSGSPGAALKRKLNLTPEKEEIKIMESSPKTPKLSK
ncbi:hypothetical protein GDO81_028388 [Engystomops pustulosus]|uniref:Zinc-ribbon domain-containing protein n=1 Tax=Engystomops pustulosus TaxID=76066 RepID=A0AAV6ZL82_ENGPU|nr:hypothetical protein GDO81_028388 [Engystomops pustulosus]